jgi:pilus assembly protein CpaC
MRNDSIFAATMHKPCGWVCASVVCTLLVLVSGQTQSLAQPPAGSGYLPPNLRQPSFSAGSADTPGPTSTVVQLPQPDGLVVGSPALAQAGDEADHEKITELRNVSGVINVAQAPGQAGPGAIPGIDQVRPAPPAAQPPLALPSEVLPSPFAADHVRLPLIAPGRTPQVSAETQKKIDRFVDAQLDTEASLNLAIGRPRLLVFKQVPFRVQIADDTIANYTLLTDRELSVVGRKLGTTVLNLWFTDPQDPKKQEIISYLLIVLPDPEAKERIELVLQGLEKEINRNFPDDVVKLSFVGDRVLVRGQAKDIESATQIIRLVGANVPDVSADTSPTPGQDRAGGAPQNETIFTTGDSVDAQNAYQEYKLANDAERQALQGNNRIINMLRIAGVHQVMLKVTVAEIDRSATRALGVNIGFGSAGFSPARFAGFYPTAPGAATIASGVTGSAISGITGGALGAGGNFLVNEGDFRLVVNALKQMNLARSLNEPNLTTLNGRPATLQVGGSFPVPTTTAQGVSAQTFQSVEYVPFGVNMRFIPTVVDGDRIRLQVYANVSDRSLDTVNVGGTSTGGGNSVGGSSVPANVDTRNFNTVVELREGQTLAAAGLLKTVYNVQSQRVPFLGEVPVVGRLFSNDRNLYSERELVILVTPYLVLPYEEHETPPLPGSDVFEPSDLEFFVLGRIEGCRAEDYRSAVRSDLRKMQAWRRCQQQYIVGPSGHSDGKP